MSTLFRLKGFNFFYFSLLALFISFLPIYLYSIVPEQWKATGQTMLTVMFFGVSGIIGSTIGGWLIDEWGGAALYRTMAVVAALGFLFSFKLVKRTA